MMNVNKKEEITVYISEAGKERPVIIPLGISMTLMEALKAFDEPIEATCGGMALCASCHVQVLDDGIDKTGELTDPELDMLETLPEYSDICRLSCQIQVSEALDGLRIMYMEPMLV